MVILDKLKDQLEQLKGKIPFLNKGASKSDTDDADESEEKAAPSSSSEPAWKANLAKQLPFLAKLLGGNKASAASEDATDANIKVPVANSSEAKRQKIIRIVLVLGALYFVYDTLMPTEEAPTEVAVETKKPEKSERRKKREAEAAAKAAADAAAAAAAGTTEQPVDSAPADKPISADVIPNATPDVPVDIPVDIPDSDVSAPIEGTAGTIAPENDVPVDTPPQEDPFATAPEGDAATQPPGMGATETGDQVSDGAGDKPTEGGGDMTEQILKDLEKQIGADQAATKEPESTSYVAPPDYENVGRGLAYNCVGKHWACIDGPSFKICQQNNTALKSQNRAKECYPDSVYQSESACGWVQKQKITGNAKTDFCN